MMWIANAIAWIATPVGVVGGIYLTKSVWCLWAFLIPALMMADYAKIYISNKEDGTEDEDEMAD